MAARHGTQRWATGVLLVAVVAVVSVAIGCSTTTPVELAQAPRVEPVDGGQGQNDAGVIEAGAIEIDTVPGGTSTTTVTVAPTTTSGTPAAPTSSTTTVPLSPTAQAMVDAMCKEAKRALRTAVDDYRADLGTAPTSEAELIAMAYIRTRSDLFDVRADGSIVAQDHTCAKAG